MQENKELKKIVTQLEARITAIEDATSNDTIYTEIRNKRYDNITKLRIIDTTKLFTIVSKFKQDELMDLFNNVDLGNHIFMHLTDYDILVCGYYPFAYAIRYGRIRVVEYVVDNMENMNIADKNGYRPIHYVLRYAYRFKSTEIIRKVIGMTHNVELYTNEIAETFINKNEFYNNIVEYINMKLNNTGTIYHVTTKFKPIHLAVIYGDIEIINIILNKSTDISGSCLFGIDIGSNVMDLAECFCSPQVTETIKQFNDRIRIEFL